ncbi:hypothetical protein [Butyrivibrio hungatei]|uniref:Uncharacterized protein n=1 Tax=Butyrivibrio hungatei TaxID=185008 RepID=A0A1D9P5S2_9FIRM|nr:hypothetical protein [Butyrivibrio hungatei]AOZ97889.1 hypothetical protein bhn_II090 [Butyrivibrio hungatei]
MEPASFIANDIFATINGAVVEGNTASKILIILEKKYHYSLEHMDDLFCREYKISIKSYIKIKQLQCAYEIWVNNGCESLTEAGEYHQIKEFKKKFRKAFGKSPEEAYSGNEDLNIYMPGAIKDVLGESILISDYRIKNGYVAIKTDPKEVFFSLMSLPVYVVPKKAWRNIYNSSNLDLEEKKLYLVLLSRGTIETSTKITMTYDECCEAVISLELYNIETPYEDGEALIFSPTIPDGYHQIFEHEIDNFISELIAPSLVPIGDKFLGNFITWKQKGMWTIDGLAKACNLSLKETKKLLWKYIKLGYIRYIPGAIYAQA